MKFIYIIYHSYNRCNIICWTINNHFILIPIRKDITLYFMYFDAWNVLVESSLFIMLGGILYIKMLVTCYHNMNIVHCEWKLSYFIFHLYIYIFIWIVKWKYHIKKCVCFIVKICYYPIHCFIHIIIVNVQWKVHIKNSVIILFIVSYIL